MIKNYFFFDLGDSSKLSSWNAFSNILPKLPLSLNALLSRIFNSARRLFARNGENPRTKIFKAFLMFKYKCTPSSDWLKYLILIGLDQAKNAYFNSDQSESRIFEPIKIKCWSNIILKTFLKQGLIS